MELSRLRRPLENTPVLLQCMIRALGALFLPIFTRRFVVLTFERLVERRFRFIADSLRDLAKTFIQFANEPRGPLHPNAGNIALRRLADDARESHGERRA